MSFFLGEMDKAPRGVSPKKLFLSLKSLERWLEVGELLKHLKDVRQLGYLSETSNDTLASWGINNG